MNKIHQHKIKSFLAKFNVEKIAKRTGFTKRRARKITAMNFLVSFYNIMLKKHFSLRAWSIELSTLINEVVSFQAVAKKLEVGKLAFAKTMFTQAVDDHIKKNTHIAKNKLYLKFNRILFEDSTCIKLLKVLAAHFPGSGNQHKRSATARIQFCFDVKSNGIENVELTSFIKSDLTYADNILKRVQAKDLIIRDLGYFVTKVLRKINDLEAFFISRYRIKTKLYTLEGEDFKLVEQLKKLDRLGIVEFDKRLKMTSTEKLEVRMVALKLDQKQATIRRKHAKKNRHANVGISKEANYLMTWNIFITNIEQEVLTERQIYEIYRLRWQIEIVFKNWKSNFEIDQIVSSCRGTNPAKPEMLLYLCLSFLAIVYIPKLNHYHKQILDQSNEHLSPLKFATFLINNLNLIFTSSEHDIITLLTKYCCYDKRTDRVNNYQKIYGMAA